jgi:mannose-6-phosphate isomerase
MSTSPQPLCSPYPLRFAPILKFKVWGGDRLARLGKDVVPGDRVGESWELADLAMTSASGGGGGEERSVIANGPLKGHTIHHAVAMWGRDLLGGAPPAPDNAFPLLVKYLDAREHLSVQVHPSPAYAAAHPGAHLKAECWYVIDAEPGSVIYVGLKPGVTREAFAAGIADGACVDMLNAIPASRGQMFFLPSGTCHALGAGVLVAEIQTPSDTTFRAYDWAKEYSREGRELHIQEALACIDFGPAPAPTRLALGETAGRVVDCSFFTVDEARLESGDALPVGSDEDCCVLMIVDGCATLIAGSEVEAEQLQPGDTVLLPVSLADEAVLMASEPTTILRATLR